MRGVIVEIAGPRFEIPYECPCCGTTQANAEVAIGPSRTLFPYCTRCVQHTKLHDAARVASALAMVITLAATIVAGVVAGGIAAAIAFVVGSTVAWLVRTARRKAAMEKRGTSCCATELAVFEHGRHAFSFESPTYAARFAEDNKARLASIDPQLQRLMDGYQRARLAVPTPAVAAGVAPPPLTHREWLVRIEATTGTLARRVQLQRALDMIEEVHLRRELLQAVARLELAPVLARAQRLASNAAKQLLEDSIARVRLDNLSEELQAAQLHELQARLADLR
jgi:hypothetical protein